MTGRGVRTALAAASVLATLSSAALGVSCVSTNNASAPSADKSAPTSPGRPALRRISLPDLSRMEKSVQQQMRESDAALRVKIENPETQTVELGNAYGAMGKLLMAAEYFDAAESSYLN